LHGVSKLSSAWSKFLTFWWRAPARSATNKENGDKDRTLGDSTSRGEWFRTSRKRTFVLLYDKKNSVQQTNKEKD